MESGFALASLTWTKMQKCVNRRRNLCVCVCVCTINNESLTICDDIHVANLTTLIESVAQFRVGIVEVPNRMDKLSNLSRIMKTVYDNSRKELERNNWFLRDKFKVVV